MKDQALYGKYSIYIISFFTEFKRACESSRIHEDSAFWLFQEFMTGPTLLAIKERLTLTPNDLNKHEGTIPSYDREVNHLSRSFDTNIIISKADEKIRNI